MIQPNTIKYCIYTLLLSYIIVSFSIFGRITFEMPDFRKDLDIAQSQLYQSANDFSVAGDVLISRSGNPRLDIRLDKSMPIRLVQINIAGLSEPSCNAQIYFADKNESYVYGKFVSFILHNGSNLVRFPRGLTANKLRFDLTDKAGVSMCVIDVSLLRNVPGTLRFWFIFSAVAVALIVLLIRLNLSSEFNSKPLSNAPDNLHKSRRMEFLYLKESLPVFAWGAGISALVYLPYLVLPLYAIDDYHLYNIYDISSSTMWYNFFSTGRFAEAFIADLFCFSNIQPLTRPIGPVLFILSLSYLGVMLANTIELKQFLLKLAFVLFVVLNPFMAELVHYSIVTSYSAIAILTLTVGFVYGMRFSQIGGWANFGLSIATYCISLSIYQIFYPMIFMFLMLQIAMIDICLQAEKIDAHAIKQRLRSLIPYLLAFIIYSAVLKFMFMISPPSLAYSGTALGDLVANLARPDYWLGLRNNIQVYVLQDNPFNSSHLNLLMWAFAAYALAEFIFYRINRCATRRDVIRILTVAMLSISAIIFGVLVCLGFSLLRPGEISSRSLTAFGIYQGLSIVCGVVLLQRSGAFTRHKAVLCAFVVCILLLGSAGRMGRIALDQYRLNSFDKSLATRIVARLESFPEFTPTAKLVILGAPSMGSLARTSFGDYNVSALQHFSRVFAINEITGYSFQNPSSGEITLARAIAKKMEPWPNAGSVKGDQGMFIVLLSR